ncbi:MAG: hydrogen peroxide-inducible genes activator [Pseudomonadota bacterium]
MESMPTLKQLRYFAVLAETGHYRRAAEQIGISQPSLSQQISNLEEVLRLPLVERGRSGAVLTPAGREVLQHAHRILADVRGLVETSDIMKSGMAGTLRLGSSPTLGPYILPNVVRSLHRSYPKLRLIVRDGSPAELVDALVAGKHDLIMTPLPIRAAEVTVTRLFREPMRLAVSRENPLAQKVEATDADLAKEGIMTLASTYAHHAQLSELAREIGATLRPDYEGTSLDALRHMTAMNMGVTFLPALYVTSEIPDPDEGDVALVPFRKGRFFRSIGIAWRTSATHTPMLKTFADLVRTTVKEHFGDLVIMER